MEQIAPSTKARASQKRVLFVLVMSLFFFFCCFYSLEKQFEDMQLYKRRVDESSRVHTRSRCCSLCMWMSCVLGVCLCSPSPSLSLFPTLLLRHMGGGCLLVVVVVFFFLDCASLLCRLLTSRVTQQSETVRREDRRAFVFTRWLLAATLTSTPKPKHIVQVHTHDNTKQSADV